MQAHKGIPRGTSIQDIFAQRPEYIADGFDFLRGARCVWMQRCTTLWWNNHSGEDWTEFGVIPIWRSDLCHRKWMGQWPKTRRMGKVMRVIHSWLIYGVVVAHNDTMLKSKGDWVQRGERIKDDWCDYYAHLHFEASHKAGPASGKWLFCAKRRFDITHNIYSRTQTKTISLCTTKDQRMNRWIYHLYYAWIAYLWRIKMSQSASIGKMGARIGWACCKQCRGESTCNREQRTNNKRLLLQRGPHKNKSP